MFTVSRLRDVPAPAKINLFLHVTGRRPDGYHLLQTAFRFIDLSDTLHFATREDGRIVRLNDVPGVPEQEDLVVRAALALQQATGTTLGADIELIKRIPMGGGLGGGSSDAATVLLALNRLWQTGLTRETLMEIGLKLGADVPVFVFGRNAFAEGVGEQLTALALPARWYVVVQPDANVPTADIFRASELTRDSVPIKIADFSASNNYFVGRNDLEAVAFTKFSEVARIAQLVNEAVGGTAQAVKQEAAMGSEHAAQSLVRMSGSGACLFVEFNDQASANAAMEKIALKMSQQPKDLPQLRINRVCAGLDVHPLLNWGA